MRQNTRVCYMCIQTHMLRRLNMYTLATLIKNTRDFQSVFVNNDFLHVLTDYAVHILKTVYDANFRADNFLSFFYTIY